jgi:hypothetical protein
VMSARIVADKEVRGWPAPAVAPHSPRARLARQEPWWAGITCVSGLTAQRQRERLIPGVL